MTPSFSLHNFNAPSNIVSFEKIGLLCTPNYVSILFDCNLSSIFLDLQLRCQLVFLEVVDQRPPFSAKLQACWLSRKQLFPLGVINNKKKSKICLISTLGASKRVSTHEVLNPEIPCFSNEHLSFFIHS